MLIPNGDEEGPCGGDGHEILNILDAFQPDCKFQHKTAPPELYKKLIFVYNGE
jgi:hypothetical protein